MNVDIPMSFVGSHLVESRVVLGEAAFPTVGLVQMQQGREEEK